MRAQTPFEDAVAHVTEMLSPTKLVKAMHASSHATPSHQIHHPPRGPRQQEEVVLVLNGHRPQTASNSHASRAIEVREARKVYTPIPTSKVRPKTAAAAASGSPSKKRVADSPKRQASPPPPPKKTFAEEYEAKLKDQQNQLGAVTKKLSSAESALHQSKQHQQRLGTQLKKATQANEMLRDRLEKYEKREATSRMTLLDSSTLMSNPEEEQEEREEAEDRSEDGESTLQLLAISEQDLAQQDAEAEAEAQRKSQERALVRRTLGFQELQRYENAVDLHSFQTVRDLFITACKKIDEMQGGEKTGGLHSRSSMRRASTAGDVAGSGGVAVYKNQISSLQSECTQLYTQLDDMNLRLQRSCNLLDSLLTQCLGAAKPMVSSASMIKDLLLGRQGKFDPDRLEISMNGLFEMLRQFSVNVRSIARQSDSVFETQPRSTSTEVIDEKVDEITSDVAEAKSIILSHAKNESMLMQLFSEEVEAYRDKVRCSLQKQAVASTQTLPVAFESSTSPHLALIDQDSNARGGSDDDDEGSPRGSPEAGVQLPAHRETTGPPRRDGKHDETSHARYDNPLFTRLRRKMGTASSLPPIIQMLIEAVNVTHVVFIQVMFGKLTPNVAVDLPGAREFRRQLIFEGVHDFPKLPQQLTKEDLGHLTEHREHAMLLLETALFWHQALPGMQVKTVSAFIDLIRRSAPVVQAYFLYERRVQVAQISKSMSSDSASNFVNILGAVLNKGSHASLDPSKAKLEKDQARHLLRVLHDMALLHKRRASMNWVGLFRLHKLMQLKRIVEAAFTDPLRIEQIVQCFKSDVLQQHQNVWHTQAASFKLDEEAMWEELVSTLTQWRSSCVESGLDVDVLDALGPVSVTKIIEKAKAISVGLRDTNSGQKPKRARDLNANVYVIDAAVRQRDESPSPSREKRR